MKAVSLYCGAGGLDAGLIKAGIEVVLAIDFWRDALRVYRANLPGVPTLRWDLSEVPDLPPADAIVGGSPCQDFTLSSVRVAGERAGQTPAFARIVAKYRPRFFCLENVEGAKTSRPYLWARAYLRGRGYGVTEVTLDASYYGVPQTRKRVILAGELGGKDDALRTLLDAGRSEKPITIREYCGTRIRIDYFYRHWFGNAAGGGKKRCIYSVDEVGPTIMCEHKRGKLPGSYKPRKGDRTTDLSRVRALTLREGAMIQTFPDDWGWLEGQVRTSDAWQMVGNAVPPVLGEHLGRALLAAAQGKTALAPGSDGDPVAFSEDSPDLELIETWDEQWRHARHATRLEWLARPAVRTAFERLIAAKKTLTGGDGRCA